ncbi:uncharacterized protein LOC144478034, partial [Augochlora pura]
MHRTLHVPGKLPGQSLVTASDASPTSRRLFIRDRKSSMQFLVDTGADLCVFPRAKTSGACSKAGYELAAANGTPIATYGTSTISLDLGLRREFIWRFVIADVSKPIIGADFLAHFGLLVDVRNRRLIDGTTTLKTPGAVVHEEVESIKTVRGDSAYHALLLSFPAITRPGGTPKEVRHDTRHHIATTPGSPVAARPRRLAPDRLSIAKRKFEVM